MLASRMVLLLFSVYGAYGDGYKWGRGPIYNRAWLDADACIRDGIFCWCYTAPTARFKWSLSPFITEHGLCLSMAC